MASAHAAILGLLALGSALGASAASAATPPPGTWANPANSVHVAFKKCGKAICGTVVWANAKAQADAARGGTDRLVGQQLFRDFVETGKGKWDGQVLVPDIGQAVTGTITLVDARTLVGEGCVMKGFGCKSQTWKRI
jgi:uncharacterized protein (DUF2147 family)